MPSSWPGEESRAMAQVDQSGAALAGARYSPVGVPRPATRQPHSRVWGMEGAGPLLDWLGIEPHYRYARSSALDDGERALTGLLLVDLPDHDSVLSGGSSEVSRL